MMRPLWFSVALLAVLGCAAESPENFEGEIVAGSAGLDGTGFVAVADGTDVELIPGSQGGFHVWLSVRIRGLSGKIYFSRTARRVRDNQLVFRGLPLAIELPEDALGEWWESPNASPAFMCPSPIGVQVFDEELIFQVEIRDDDDLLLATDALILVPHCPQGDLGDFCYEICAG